MGIRNKVKRIVPCKVSSVIKEHQIRNNKGENRPKAGEMPLYNSLGEKMKTFYLLDGNCQMEFSMTFGRVPRYIYWDRARYNLPDHFYTDDMLFMSKGVPTTKYGMLLEPPTLQPKIYKKIYNDPRCMSEYNCFFTHDQRLLEKLPNSKPLIIGGVYVGTKYGGGAIDSRQYEKKEKNISIVSSNKRWCELHKFRYAIAKKYEYDDRVDCYGTFNGNFIKIADSLMKYRYSFAIENCISPYWITERICNCFATMTVPIYLGSPNIGKFFNMDGIVIIEKKDLNKIDEIIRRCNEKDYYERLDAILDNFERVKKYMCIEDWLCENYNFICG